MRNKLTTILAIFFLCSPFLYSQQTRKECQVLIEMGIKALNEKNCPEALKKLTKAELMAKNKHWPDKLWYIKNNLGRLYDELSNYGEALGYYNEGLNIVKETPSLKKKKIVLWNNIGTLYSSIGDDTEALNYYKKAFKAAQKYDSDYEVFMRKILSANIAGIYNERGDLKMAQKILEEAKSIQTKAYGMQAWEIIYTKNLYLRGNVKEARKRAETLFQKTQKDKKGTCHKCTLNLLAEMYSDLNQWDKAIEYINKMLEFNTEWSTRIDGYDRLAMLYRQKGNMEKALSYKDSVIWAKDSLVKRNNAQLFQINKIKFDIQKYQNQLKVNKETRQTERTLFYSLIGVILLICFFIFIVLKNRIVKQKQRRILAENQQKIAELNLKQEKNEHLLLERKMVIQENKSKLKQEQLKNKISQKNRLLSASALYHSGRNELLGKIISSLAEISTISKNKAINDYIKELKGHLKTDAKWEDFVTHFEKVNPGFLKKLKEAHPQLTKTDIRFLCYLYMNISTNEICTILNITAPAFWKRKQRLSEKMNLKKGELFDYILNLA